MVAPVLRFLRPIPTRPTTSTLVISDFGDSKLNRFGTAVGMGGQTDGDWSQVARRNPSQRVGTMEDIAGLAIFLSSRAGAYTVGETIACDGGAVASAHI